MKYPFQPEILDALPEELAELFRSLELVLLDEICSRLKAADELNEVTVQNIRALRSHSIDLKEIKKAILDKRNRLRSLNISDTQEAEKALSQEEEFLNSLSKDIWLLVLSKEQEDFLTISREEMGVIAQYRTGKEG